MKKLFVFAMVATVLTIFNGCQKDELNISHLTDDVQPQEVVKPDVYVEGDYLVFKDFETYDSIAGVLNNGSLKFIKEFETKLGFKSAFTYRQESLEKLNTFTEMESISFLNLLSKEGYFNLESQEFTYPFYNETRSVVLNKTGKVKIGRAKHEFKGFVQEIKLSSGEKTITVDHNASVSNLKSAEILFDNTTAGGQQRLTMRVLREDEAVTGLIYVPGVGLVEGIVGYNWKISLRFHSWRQRTLSKSDENTYFHYIKRHKVIGGNQITTNEGLTNYYYSLVNENPSNPYTETSPWKAIYYLTLYETGLNPGINSPTIHNIDYDCWSDRLTSPINYVDYSD